MSVTRELWLNLCSWDGSNTALSPVVKDVFSMYKYYIQYNTARQQVIILSDQENRILYNGVSLVQRGLW